MRPHEPSVPPYRNPGAGDDPTRRGGPGPYGSDDYGGRVPSHARPHDDAVDQAPADPYGDVPAPPRPAGVQAPYGSSGWSGSDQYGDPDDGLGVPGGRGQGMTGNGLNGHGSNGYGVNGHGADGRGANGRGPHGDGVTGYGSNGHGGTAYGANGYGANGYGPPGAGSAPAGNGHGPGTPGGRPPADHLRAPSGPPWAPTPPPAPPFGVHRPDGRPPGPPAPSGPPPMAPPAAPAGPPPPAPEAPASTPEPTASSSASSSATPVDSGLAGADGFASRPPRPRDPATTTSSTATTTVTRGAGGAGAGPGRHRRGGGTGLDREDDVADDASEPGSGPGRSGRHGGDKGEGKTTKKKRKGSFWRELPLLIVVAVVLTFVIQTFLARIYVIPSASMERTLHGCNGCANDRVAVDKITYRFSDPQPGDVVVFRGPPTWSANDEVSGGEPSGNVLVRGLQSGLSLVGLAPPDEKDFVKRVIATGGQTVACCDAQNRVTVDGRPLTEPYIYYQPNLGRTQADFAPVRVPDGQLWVMGDNRNNSADARVHGPIGVTDVIGKARVIVLPVGRWSGVPDPDPQAQPAAIGAPPWTQSAPLAAGVLAAVPLVGVSRRLRRRWASHGDPAQGCVSGEPPPSSPDPGR